MYMLTFQQICLNNQRCRYVFMKRDSVCNYVALHIVMLYIEHYKVRRLYAGIQIAHLLIMFIHNFMIVSLNHRFCREQLQNIQVIAPCHKDSEAIWHEDEWSVIAWIRTVKQLLTYVHACGPSWGLTGQVKQLSGYRWHRPTNNVVCWQRHDYIMVNLLVWRLNSPNILRVFCWAVHYLCFLAFHGARDKNNSSLEWRTVEQLFITSLPTFGRNFFSSVAKFICIGR